MLEKCLQDLIFHIINMSFLCWSKIVLSLLVYCIFMPSLYHLYTIHNINRAHVQIVSEHFSFHIHFIVWCHSMAALHWFTSFSSSDCFHSISPSNCYWVLSLNIQLFFLYHLFIKLLYFISYSLSNQYDWIFSFLFSTIS